MTIATINMLSRVPLLAGLDEKALTSLSRAMQDRTFSKGERPTVEGHVGIGFFIVLDGTATVTVEGSQVRTLGPGDYFGEMALLVTDGLRTATITADTDLHCVGMTAWEFRPFLTENPEVAWQVMETMARRLADDARSRA